MTTCEVTALYNEDFDEVPIDRYIFLLYVSCGVFESGFRETYFFLSRISSFKHCSDDDS
jgi:hypothetical protein